MNNKFFKAIMELINDIIPLTNTIAKIMSKFIDSIKGKNKKK